MLCIVEPTWRCRCSNNPSQRVLQEQLYAYICRDNLRLQRTTYGKVFEIDKLRALCQILSYGFLSVGI